MPKANPKHTLIPACLDHDDLFFVVVMWIKDLPCTEADSSFPKPAIEALRGPARPDRGHALDAKHIGTRTKRGSRGLETI